MKTQHTLTAALAAIAGLSFATLYAEPSYTPNANSPINTTPLLNSTSQNLNNFDDYIGVIDGFLTGTESLVLPTPSGSTFPIFANFNTAVAAAVAANPADTQKIVAAAVQYQAGNYAGKVKDIVKLIATNTPSAAEDAVIGAVAGNSAKAADAAAGAILGIIASAEAATADYGDIADESIEPSTHALIEKVAKAAVGATKTKLASAPGNAVDVATALVDAVLADGAAFYIDDVAKGVTAGALGQNATGTVSAQVAAAALARLNATAFENSKFVAEFVGGALRSMVVSGVSGSTAYNNVLAALQGEPSVGQNFLSTISAVNAANLALRNAPGGTEVTVFNAALTNAFASDLEAFMIGAAQNKSSKAADFVAALYNDPDIGSPSLAVKQAVAGAAARAKFSGAGKVVSAAILAGGTPSAPGANGIARDKAVEAVIPNSTWEFAGVITNSAIKTIDPLSLSDAGTVNANTQADDLASVALTTAVSAGYAGSINDIALQAVKARKKEGAAIVEALTKNANSAGWREAIVAQAVINDKASVAVLKGAAQNGATAAGASAFELASLNLAGDIALDAKNNSKVVYDAAIKDFFGADVDVAGNPTPRSEFAKAIFFGRGGVNIKNAGPLLAVAMKFNTGATTNADLLGIAKAVYKKNASVLDLQYSVIQDALANPNQLFDLVDHQVFTHASKFAPDIVSAAVAARPEFAHYAARAGAFRAPASAGKVGAAAITYAHMTVNRDTAGALIANPSDTAAVAAISSATILGILDANLPTSPANKREAAVKAAAGSLVKAALLLESSSNEINQFDGTVGVPSKAKGSAAAVTGMLAQIIGNAAAGSADTTTLSPLAATALLNAAKAAKKEGLQIAQAAAHVAQFIFNANGGVGSISNTYKAAIVAAVVGAGALGNIAGAVDFGVAEGQVASNYGAGAAGILNYAHRSGTGTPVTSLENF